MTPQSEFALSAVAAGVASPTPEHARAATAAARTAINAIDGVVEVMRLTGALPKGPLAGAVVGR